MSLVIVVIVVFVVIVAVAVAVAVVVIIIIVVLLLLLNEQTTKQTSTESNKQTNDHFYLAELRTVSVPKTN